MVPKGASLNFASSPRYLALRKRLSRLRRVGSFFACNHADVCEQTQTPLFGEGSVLEQPFHQQTEAAFVELSAITGKQLLLPLHNSNPLYLTADEK